MPTQTQGQTQRMDACPDPDCMTTDFTDHTHACVVTRIHWLRTHNLQTLCPLCKVGQVGINASDFFECRGCGAQFSCCLVDGEKLRQTFVDALDGGVVRVKVLLAPGEGDFPLDRALAQLEADLAALEVVARATGRNRRRKQ